MQAPEVIGGRYELRGVLGRGGMAEVRDGWDTRLARAVAIKLLHPAFSANPNDRTRFEIEARAAAALNHPHIVAVHDSGDHAGAPYIVMERLSGRTLGDAIARGPLPQEQVRSILNDVLSALAVAHAAGVLHRDIKPANILFSATGGVKVADFGIAKSGETPHTMTGQIVGTMGYLSPDRLSGRPATVADDLYAVGVVGYEALTGRRPFPQENLVALARAIAADRPPPVTVLRPDVDPGLAALIARAMAREPQWRYPSAEAMRAALFGQVEPVTTPGRPPTRVLAEPLPPPPTLLVPRQVRRGRSRKVVVLAAALVAFVIAAAAFIADSSSRAPAPEPAGTRTTITTPPPTFAPPPPPPTTPSVQVDQGNPKKNGDGNNGKGPKKRGEGGG